MLNDNTSFGRKNNELTAKINKNLGVRSKEVFCLNRLDIRKQTRFVKSRDVPPGPVPSF